MALYLPYLLVLQGEPRKEDSWPESTKINQDQPRSTKINQDQPRSTKINQDDEPTTTPPVDTKD